MATTNGITPAELNRKLITPGAELSKVEFKQAVTNFRSEIEAALPVHLKRNAEKYARQAMSLFSQNPKLQKCTGVTILSALMTASALGLDLTPQLGQCYIIPYDNKKKTAKGWETVTEAQFQLGYRGTISLAQRSGELLRIQADVVCERDKFRYSKGLNPILEHEESMEEDRGQITHVYAVANFKNGGYAFEVWPVAKVIAHAKKFSKSFYKRDYKTGKTVENDKSPWHTDFESMAKKTLIMAIWKYLPLSTELMLAQNNDNAVKRELGDIATEKDIITVTPSPVEDEELPAEFGEAEEVVISKMETTTAQEPPLAPIDPTPVDPNAPENPESSKQEKTTKTPTESTTTKQPPFTELEKLRVEVSNIMGPEGLDYTFNEQAEFLFQHGGDTVLNNIKAPKLAKILSEARVLLQKKDAEAAREGRTEQEEPPQDTATLPMFSEEL